MPKTSTSATSDLVLFRRRLMRWYRENGRHALPWRLTRDPYAVLASEVMLQQTQVDRVLPYYTAWLERWPTLEALAASSPAEVIRAWRGLGYNRRALALHTLARTVVREHGVELPGDETLLRRLPGVGPYTAAAVRCFALEENGVVADTNIARVLTRHFAGVANQRVVGPKTVANLAGDVLPKRNARDHNLALMDLGALVCTARAPDCGSCPVAGSCAWRAAGAPSSVLVGPATQKFETTARFARGRIVDLLREAPMPERELALALPPEHAARTVNYLAALERDGIVVRLGEAWSLPG